MPAPISPPLRHTPALHRWYRDPRSTEPATHPLGHLQSHPEPAEIDDVDVPDTGGSFLICGRRMRGPISTLDAAMDAWPGWRERLRSISPSEAA